MTVAAHTAELAWIDAARHNIQFRFHSKFRLINSSRSRSDNSSSETTQSAIAPVLRTRSNHSACVLVGCERAPLCGCFSSISICNPPGAIAQTSLAVGVNPFPRADVAAKGTEANRAEIVED